MKIRAKEWSELPCIDLHTHTIACGHGYSTLKENIEAAKEAGLEFLGLSEHAPALPGGTHPFFFSSYGCIPRKYGDLCLLCGAEVNIMDYEGNLDLEEWCLDRIDYAIASMHIPCVKPGSREENTRALINAMKNPYVKIIGHPDDSRYPLDYEVLVQAAKEEGVFLELNNSSLNPKSPRKGGRENAIELLNTCKKYQVPIIMGSDSHISYTIGHFERALEVVEEVDFPKELIANYHPYWIGEIMIPGRLREIMNLES